MMVPTNCTVEQFLIQKFTLPMEHPPSNFFLFPTIKTLLKGVHFELSEVVFQHMLHMLKVILEDIFKKCFQMQQKGTAQCTAAKGNYFEEGNNNWQTFNLLLNNLCTFQAPPKHTHTPITANYCTWHSCDHCISASQLVARCSAHQT